MPLDPAFVADCPYGPEGIFIDDLISIDHEAKRLVCRAPVSADLPLTRTQRNHPEKHPPHVSGGLMIHITGIAGFMHAYYILGLRHAEGWVGYGARLSDARFHALANLEQPLTIECVARQVKRSPSRVFCRYQFRFLQGDKLVYEGDQTAMFVKVPGSA